MPERIIFPQIRSVLDALVEESCMRTIPREFGDAHRDFSSNDYMGLRNGSRLESAFGSEDMSSSASRLLSASQNPYSALERYLGDAYGRDALLFNSGYHANTGIISAIGSLPSTLIVADRLVHASIIDGICLSRADFVRFRHNDMDNLRSILGKKRDSYSNILIITESLFSMDGDRAPLRDLVDIKNEYGAMLYVDEAHSFGVAGRRGLGVAEENDLISGIEIIAGTFGKACGSIGAFAAVDTDVKKFLVNKSRSLIFSTSLPPANVRWTLYNCRRLSEMREQREYLASLSGYFRRRLNEMGVDTAGSSSQIIPLITGNAAKALRISQSLSESGVRALAIRKPTVPAGKERIRFSLGAHHTREDVDFLLDILEKTL